MNDGFRWHGGRLDDARAQFGDGDLPWLDLSTGINPVAWPMPEPLRFDWQALPAPSSLARLEEVAARYFGVDPALCCAVPGSEIGLRLLGNLIDLPGRYLPPCYRTHAEVFAVSKPGQIGHCESKADALLTANPNNPDGRVVEHETLRKWLGDQEAMAGWLIVDEAFADPAPDTSVAGLVSNERNLVVMRSFGKFFGLAGVRLGFAIAPPPITAVLRHLLGEWPISAPAIEIGTKAYADRGWIAATRANLPLRARALDEVLLAHGLVPTGGSPLFRLVETERAGELFERFARHQILTRPFCDNDHWLRFGIPADRTALDRVHTVLAHG
ncbi:threonine-phosphate decarboxylase [Croceicoccus naphthovorans]|uniref:Aminotransferase n=1 Tax=Croceicoccus naphthovorans TaxID=1348774 RepID=A0A0G3XM16_9SPHN|nr:threonine-phosphate decarboxylase [Croceicoccus naphthovorans]AKM11666.1 aminotransferase [Croceicoccus naphthovorans]MBB3991147.1 cobalamin biosynthetic protein CobC [Croceicoccus naphthovorans]